MSEVGPDQCEDFGVSTDNDMKGLERPEADFISDLSRLDSRRARLKAVSFPFQMGSFSILEVFAKIFSNFIPRVKHNQNMFV